MRPVTTIERAQPAIGNPGSLFDTSAAGFLSFPRRGVVYHAGKSSHDPQETARGLAEVNIAGSRETAHRGRREARETRGQIMTNEELAIRAKAHEDLAVLELWEAVRRFVEMKAARYILETDYNTLAEYDDLLQDGFIAMMDAVEIFDPERGAGFLKVLVYTLQKRFAEEGGHRSSKRDPLRLAGSLDAPLYQGEEDGDSIADALPDPCGEYAFALVEYEDYIEFARRLLYTAMGSLTDTQRDYIHKHYFLDIPMSVITGTRKSGRRAAWEAVQRGLRYLRRGRYRRELRAALQGFEDFRELQLERRHAVELHAIAKSGAGE